MKVYKAEDLIEHIRTLLRTTGDGRISVSPYDTAWVALIKDLQGRDAPQFPSSLEWIVKNQLEDGSWGDEKLFCIYDRLVNTIACVVALRSWHVCAVKVRKGTRKLLLLKKKINKTPIRTYSCKFIVILNSGGINRMLGVKYIEENVDKLREGNVEHMTCGFEIVFPELLQKAKSLGIEDLPYDAPVIQEIYQTREKKLKR